MEEKRRKLEGLLALLNSSGNISSEEEEYYRSWLKAASVYLADGEPSYEEWLVEAFHFLLSSLPEGGRRILLRLYPPQQLPYLHTLYGVWKAIVDGEDMNEEESPAILLFHLLSRVDEDILKEYIHVLREIADSALRLITENDVYWWWAVVAGRITEQEDFALLLKLLNEILALEGLVEDDISYLINQIGYIIFMRGLGIDSLKEYLSEEGGIPLDPEDGDDVIIRKVVISHLSDYQSLMSLAEELGVSLWEERLEFFKYALPEPDMVDMGNNIFYVIPRAHLECDDKVAYNGGYFVVRIPGMVRVDFDQAPKEEILEGLKKVAPQPRVIVETQKGYAVLWDLDDFLAYREVIENLPGIDGRYIPQSFVRVSAKLGRPKDELKFIKGPQWLAELIASLREGLPAYMEGKYVTLYRWVSLWEEGPVEETVLKHMLSSSSVWFALTREAHEGMYGNILIEVDVSIHAFMKKPPVPYWCGNYDTPPAGDWGRRGEDLVFNTKYLLRFIKEKRVK